MTTPEGLRAAVEISIQGCRGYLGPGRVPQDYQDLRGTFHAFLWDAAGVDYSAFGDDPRYAEAELLFMLWLLADLRSMEHPPAVGHLYDELRREAGEAQEMSVDILREHTGHLAVWGGGGFLTPEDHDDEGTRRRKQLVSFLESQRQEILARNLHLARRLCDEGRNAVLPVVRVSTPGRGVVAVLDGHDDPGACARELVNLAYADDRCALRRSAEGVTVLCDGAGMTRGDEDVVLAELFGADSVPGIRAAFRKARNRVADRTDRVRGKQPARPESPRDTEHVDKGERAKITRANVAVFAELGGGSTVPFAVYHPSGGAPLLRFLRQSVPEIACKPSYSGSLTIALKGTRNPLSALRRVGQGREVRGRAVVKAGEGRFDLAEVTRLLHDGITKKHVVQDPGSVPAPEERHEESDPAQASSPATYRTLDEFWERGIGSPAWATIRRAAEKVLCQENVNFLEAVARKENPDTLFHTYISMEASVPVNIDSAQRAHLVERQGRGELCHEDFGPAVADIRALLRYQFKTEFGAIVRTP